MASAISRRPAAAERESAKSPRLALREKRARAGRKSPYIETEAFPSAAPVRG